MTNTLTLPQVWQEPVAWQFRMRMVDDEEWSDWYSCLKDVAESCWHTPVLRGRQREARALYTHPQPKREPLTDEQIDSLAMDEDGLPNSHIEFARVIERAHGIGGEA